MVETITNSSDVMLSILTGVSLGLIALITTIGNVIVLLAFYFDQKLRTINDYFIMNMAIADFLVGCFCIPFYIPSSIKQSWPFGRLFCQIWVTVDDVATMASVINIVAISVNRYWLIAYPISYRKYIRQHLVYFVMAGIWFISLINFAPGIWFMNFLDNKEEKRNGCSGDYNRSFVYMLIAQFNYFIWPFILLCLLNLLIMLNIWKRTRKMTQLKSFQSKIDSEKMLREKRKSSLNCQEITRYRTSFIEEYSPIIPHKHQLNGLDITTKSYKTNTNSSKDCRSSPSILFSRKSSNLNYPYSSPHGNHSLSHIHLQIITNINDERKAHVCLSQRDLRINRDRKAARSLFILVMVFLIFLFPYVICAIISTAGFHISPTISEISFWLLWLNSTCNPFLYPFIQTKYRRAYAKLFQSCFKRTNLYH